VPKELIHFTIAERTAKRLADTRFAPCLDAETDGLLLGAVCHDALFYAITPRSKAIESLAHTLHGSKGEDTYTLLRLQVAHATKKPKTSLPVALLVGMVSHFCADVVMHPMVYHYTGNYYSENAKERSIARQRHRALESLMDMVACPDKIDRARYSIRLLLRRCSDLIETGLPVAGFAQMTHIPKAEVQKGMEASWITFALLQAAYPISWLSRILFKIRRYAPASLAEITTLFYAPQLMQQADKLSNTILYTHPITGEPTESSLNTLMDEAASMAESLCRTLEPAVFDGKEIDLTHQGPSLDAGMVDVTTNDMRHFAHPPFPHLT